MIVIDPIPGQEEWNADYVAGSGAGVQLQAAGVGAARRALPARPARSGWR